MRHKSNNAQRHKVIKYITDFGSITGSDAFLDLGIMHLPSVIRDCKKDGYIIAGEWETGKNRYGEKIKWVRYSFGENYGKTNLDRQ